MNQGPGNSDWRQGMDSGNRESWRRPQKLPQAAPRRWRRWMKMLAALVGLACALILIALLWAFLGQSSVNVIAFSISPDEGEQLPFSNFDVERFLSLDSGKSWFQNQKIKSIRVEQNTWAKFTEQAGKSNDSQVLIVYLAGECAIQRKSNSSNQSDYELGIQGTKSIYPLSDLWKALDKGQKKIVLLDLALSRTSTIEAPLPLPLAALLEKEIELARKTHKLKNLAVISSDTISTHAQGSAFLKMPDEPVRKGSVFANLILKGLTDPNISGQDRRISVNELYQYVKKQVLEWSWKCRSTDCPQVPVLYAASSTSDVMKFSLAPFPKKSDGESRSADPDFNQLVDDYYRLGSSKIHRVPVAINEFQDTLRRAESQYLFRQTNSFDNSVEKLKAIQSTILEQDISPASLLPKDPSGLYVRRVFGQRIDEAYSSKTSNPVPSKADDLKTPTDISQSHLESFKRRSPESLKDLSEQAISLRKRADRLLGSKLGCLFWVESELRQLDEEVREVENLVLAMPISDDKGPATPPAELQQVRSGAENRLKKIESTITVLTDLQEDLNRAHWVLPQCAEWVAARISPDTVDRLGTIDGLLKVIHEIPKDESGGPAPQIAKYDWVPPYYRELKPGDINLLEPKLIESFAIAREARRMLFADKPASVVEQHAHWDQLQTIQTQLKANLDSLQMDLEAHVSQVASIDTKVAHANDLRAVSDSMYLTFVSGDARRRLVTRFDDFDKQLNNNSDFGRDSSPQVVAQQTDNTTATEKSLDSIVSNLVTVCRWRVFWRIQRASLTFANPQSDAKTYWMDWYALPQRQSVTNPVDDILTVERLNRSIRDHWLKEQDHFQARIERQSKDFVQHYRDFRQADLSVRAMVSSLGRKFADLSQKVDQIELLGRTVYLAERSAQDYWAAEHSQDAADDWYQLSSQETSKVASKISNEKVTGAAWASTRLKSLDDRLKELSDVSLKPKWDPAKNKLTYYANQSQIGILVEPDSRAPQGTAALRIEEERPADVKPEVGVSINPLVAPIPAKASHENPNPMIAKEFTIRTPDNRTGRGPDLRPEVTYRGHRWSSVDNLKVDVPPNEGRYYEYRSSNETSSILVKGNSLRKVLIVLDQSDSMKDPLKTGGTKIEVAKAVLKKFIESQEKEMRLGLATFGTITSSTDFEDVNKTDFTLIESVGFMNDVKKSRMVSAIGSILRDKDNKETRGGAYTFCLNATAKGLAELNSSGRKDGANSDPGVLLVITDGATNDGSLQYKGEGADRRLSSETLGQSRSNNWSLLIDQLKKMESNEMPPHKIIVVEYWGADDEKPENENNPNRNQIVWSKERIDRFEADVKEYGNGRIQLLQQVDNAASLKSAVDAALVKRQYVVIRDSLADRTVELGSKCDNLEPGTYKVSFDNRDYLIALKPGQNLELDARWDSSRNEYQFERMREVPKVLNSSISSIKDVPDSEDISQNESGYPPRFAAVKRLPSLSNPDSLTACFDIVLDHDRNEQVIRPQELLISVLADGQPVRSNVSITDAFGYRTPAYHVEVSNWPNDEIPPVIDLAWKMNRTRVTKVIEFGANETFDDGKLTWQVRSYQNDTNDGIEYIVNLEPSQVTSGADRVAEFAIRPEMMRIELVSDTADQFTPIPTNMNRVEWIGGRLKATIVPKGVVPNSLKIGITTIDAQLEGAVRLEHPLEASASQ